MENEIIATTNLAPALMKTMSLSIRLEGWPAAVTTIAIFGICALVYAFKPIQPPVVYASDGSCKNEEFAA